jgi:hypothetical protein
VSSPLNLNPATTPLPKFKDHFPKFSCNGTISVNEHLISFSNFCHNIGTNDNDTCMRLFVNSLEGKAFFYFFELPPNLFSTWDKFVTGLNQLMDNLKVPINLLKSYNNLTYNQGETINDFNLCFTKLYNQIPEIIRPHNQGFSYALL